MPVSFIQNVPQYIKSLIQQSGPLLEKGIIKQYCSISCSSLQLIKKFSNCYSFFFHIKTSRFTLTHTEHIFVYNYFKKERIKVSTA
jgi:hypothetical protein